MIRVVFIDSLNCIKYNDVERLDLAAHAQFQENYVFSLILVLKTCIFISHNIHVREMSLVMRKPVFGVDQTQSGQYT